MSILFINLVGPARFTAIVTTVMIVQLVTCEAVFAHEVSPGKAPQLVPVPAGRCCCSISSLMQMQAAVAAGNGLACSHRACCCRRQQLRQH
jgi:hypothetical protein